MYASKPMEYRLVETHSVPGRKRNSKRDANIVNKFLLINKFHHISNGLSIAVSTSGKSTLISYFNIFYIKNLLFQYSFLSHLCQTELTQILRIISFRKRNDESV